MESDSSTLCLPYHGSCVNCHHFHINTPFTINLNPETHTRLTCERCGHSLFGLGRTSIQSSLASVETVTSVKTDHSDPDVPLRTVSERSTTKESLPQPSETEPEFLNIFLIASHPPKKLASSNLFKGIANKISRRFQKRGTRIDQKVDNETETQSVLAQDHDIGAAHLRERRREKTLNKERLQNDAKDRDPKDRPRTGFQELSHIGRLFDAPLRKRSSLNSLNSVDSRISVRSSVSISYTSVDGRRRRIEHRTHSALEFRNSDIVKAKDGMRGSPSLLRQGKESPTGSEFLSSIGKRGFLHGRSSSLSMPPQAKAAQSMNLNADDPPRISNLFEQERDLAK